MNIDKETCNKINLCASDILWLEDDGFEIEQSQIIKTTRIGIASAGVEWASKLLRFYVINPHVSKRDKKAEEQLKINI